MLAAMTRSNVSSTTLPDPGADAVIELRGTLDRVIFHNSENGYTVFKLQSDGRDEADSVSVVGHMGTPEVGGSLCVRGQWVNSPRFGRQFRMDSFEPILPSTAEGIKLYLASGLIKGIGLRLAERIVARFGDQTLRILDQEPDQLRQVSGVGKKNLEGIKNSWRENQGIRELMLFLQPHGISAAYAVRIYRFYGQEALAVVRENPYRMAMDIHGIGFLTADMLADKLGFAREDPLRVQAGALYTLLKAADEGNVYYPREELVALICEQLHVADGLVEAAIDQLEREERVVLEDLGDRIGVYLSRLHHYETKIAFYLQRILHSPKSVRFPRPDEAVVKVVHDLGLELAPEQIEAVRTASGAKIMIVTGGPGTGKTTIVNGIVRLFADAKARILMAAPTGRAAKRLSETAGREARTIHRLLEYSPKEDGFARNEDKPLACGLLVVDEASMMDVMLAYHLLKAVPAGATVVFVGDINQLPSVGPGNVLKDFIASGAVPVVELVEVFRQAAESEIVMNAHRINRGEVPPLEASRERLSDFYFLRQPDPERAADMIVDLVRNHIPRRFGLDAVEDIQVLTPMHKGLVGAGNLNLRLQQVLGRQRGDVVQRGERQFRVGDKVMQIRNNYDKDVYNGDIGRVAFVDAANRELSIRFDDRMVPYEAEELDEVVMAYAISIHKSQGSEYPAVVIPIMTQHYVMLQRNLIYTAVTRGKNLVVLVGESKALAMAVRNNRMQKRHTWLDRRLTI